MAFLAEDPNLSEKPDFSADEHQAARNRLMNNLVDEDEAIRILGTLWDLTNDTAKERWAARLAEGTRAAEARRLANEEADLQCQLELDEERETALKEERKKNKAKYEPIRDIDIPSDPIIIPSHYASRKIKKGDYCELYYFTNTGLKEASKHNLSIDPEALVMLPTADGQHSWIPAGAARDPKSAATQDDELSWEEFNEAAPRMINSMRENGWPDDRIDMHILFWSGLQTHRWRHTSDKIKQRALLVYQSKQHRRWHLTAGGPHSYSLARVNQDLLDETKEELLDQSRNRAALAHLQVSPQRHPCCQTTSHFPFFLPPHPFPLHPFPLPPLPFIFTCGPILRPRTYADQTCVLALTDQTCVLALMDQSCVLALTDQSCVRSTTWTITIHCHYMGHSRASFTLA